MAAATFPVRVVGPTRTLNVSFPGLVLVVILPAAVIRYVVPASIAFAATVQPVPRVSELPRAALAATIEAPPPRDAAAGVPPELSRICQVSPVKVAKPLAGIVTLESS